MVVPNIWTFSNGLSASITCIVGYIVGIVALVRYIKYRRNALSYVCFIGFLMGTFYLDITISFITVLVWQENLIDPIISGWIAFTPAIFIIAVISRLATKIFLVKIEKLAIVLIIILIPFFLFILYWAPLYFGDPNLVLGGFIDTYSYLVKHQAGLILWIIISFFLLLNIIVVSGGFFKLAKKLTGEPRKRCILISIGFLIFSIGNFIDMTLPAVILTTIILIPTRISLAISYILIYQGFLYYVK